MATEIILPKLGMNTETATIVQWQKAEGDMVTVGDVLAEVETDKANIELEAEVGGVLRRRFAFDGDRVAVSQTIGVIGSADEDISALEQRALTKPADGASFVERVYRVWHDPSSGANTNGNHPTIPKSVSSVAPVPATDNQSKGVLDPNVIRSRLTQRGILAPTGGPTVPATTRLVIYGAGLGAKQLLEVTRLIDRIEVIGLIDDDPNLQGGTIGDKRVLGGFSALVDLYDRGLVDGVALSFHSQVRKKIHERIKAGLNIRLLPLVDPRAIVGMNVTIEDGVLIEAGSVIGPGTVVAEGTIVDLGVVVAHDCYLGPFSHLSPGCSLSGVVCLKQNVLVGVGAALNSTITIGSNVIITPGAAVMNDVPDDVVVGGVPAKLMGASRRGE